MLAAAVAGSHGGSKVARMLYGDCAGKLAEGWHATLEAKGFDSVEAELGVGLVLAVKDEVERVRVILIRRMRRRANERASRAHPKLNESPPAL